MGTIIRIVFVAGVIETYVKHIKFLFRKKLKKYYVIQK